MESCLLMTWLLMSESMQNLREKFLKWKEALESKKLKINLRKTKGMVSDWKEMLESKVYSHARCVEIVTAKLVLST